MNDKGKKKIIIGILIVTMFVFSGCDKKEVTFVEADQSQETEVETGQILDEETYTVQSGQEIYVHVCGAVISPGVYELSGDARVYEAIEKAGGFLEAAYPEALNLAQILQDGEQIMVPTREQWEQWQEERDGSKEQAAGNEETRTDGLININTATKEELCTLPGVGESRADSIIAYREEKGAFSTTTEIKNVTGIKDGLFQKIKDKIKVK